MKENSFKQAKGRNKTITDTDDTDDIVILANTPAPAEFLLLRLERSAGGRGLYVNANKTEYTSFNQRGDISTLKCDPWNLVDKFIYHDRSVLSTETDINTRLAKAWTANDSLPIIWKSDLTVGRNI